MSERPSLFEAVRQGIGQRDHPYRLDRELAAQEALEDLAALLEDARQVLIDHAVQLPLNRRDHGPMLARIDAALDRRPG